MVFYSLSVYWGKNLEMFLSLFFIVVIYFKFFKDCLIKLVVKFDIVIKYGSIYILKRL